MGALHAGHEALLHAARPVSESLVVTIFVNPMQFGPAEDFARYPRTLDADVERCAAAGADLVWAPSVDDVYPGGEARVRIDPGPLGAVLEGATRPGHFAGVLTVVAKFFGLVRPAVGLLRREGLPAADADPADGRGPRPGGRRRRRAHRARAGRARAVQPQRLPVRGRARAGARAVPGAVRGPGRGPARRDGGPGARRGRCSRPSRTSSPTTSSCATPTSARRPSDGPARLLVAARVGRPG